MRPCTALRRGSFYLKFWKKKAFELILKGQAKQFQKTCLQF